MGRRSGTAAADFFVSGFFAVEVLFLPEDAFFEVVFPDVEGFRAVDVGFLLPDVDFPREDVVFFCAI